MYVHVWEEACVARDTEISAQNTASFEVCTLKKVDLFQEDNRLQTHWW